MDLVLVLIVVNIYIRILSCICSMFFIFARISSYICHNMVMALNTGYSHSLYINKLTLLIFECTVLSLWLLLQRCVSIRSSTQHAIYELCDLCRWYRVAGTDPLTRKLIKWKHIIPAGQHRKKFKNWFCTREECRPLSNLWWIMLLCIVHMQTTLRNIFASSLTGLCLAIPMRVEMCAGGILWYNSQRAFIQLLVAMKLPLLVLKEPQQQEDHIWTTHWNKTEMICAYTNALVTCQRVCDVLQRPKSHGYTSKVQVGYDDAWLLSRCVSFFIFIVDLVCANHIPARSGSFEQQRSMWHFLCFFVLYLNKNTQGSSAPPWP